MNLEIIKTALFGDLPPVDPVTLAGITAATSNRATALTWIKTIPPNDHLKWAVVLELSRALRKAEKHGCCPSYYLSRNVLTDLIVTIQKNERRELMTMVSTMVNTLLKTRVNPTEL